MRIGSNRVTDSEWRELRRLIPTLNENRRQQINTVLTSRDKSISTGIRQDVIRELSYRPSGLGFPGAARPEPIPDPFFELQWLRAVSEKPALSANRRRNRDTMYNAYYNRELSQGIREHFMELWERRLGRPVRETWVYEGWYDEMEEPPEEVEETPEGFEEKPEL